ncbi:helix-turn-helix transcriptional regulator [Luteibacter aegosomatissinici]|uniref:helix-turn-helix transcriptional regulator n=1 Tax=Luteibacter aegosomatissinici TaxID=2911539 RepID=UPI001FF86BC7|nr:DNA-binding protein [Luteibacter aegosomatissinici]UPG92442.1 DNA-binding protein [Luteibacter aegosomatissinici]
MKEYTFNLAYHLDPSDSDHDVIEGRFDAAGLHDFLLGIGRPGQVGLIVSRKALSADAALSSIMADAQRMLGNARLIEVGPDFSGLTDIADHVGVSRQNMRKLMLTNVRTFPLPVHGGNASVWHTAEILTWLREHAGYEIGDEEIAAAFAAWRVNAGTEAARRKRAGHAGA